MEEQISRIAAQVADRLFIEVEASGRHVHLTKEQAVTLFGHGLTPQRPLSLPGQFVCQERVEVLGPKGSFPKVAVLGPERKAGQVEISLTDAVSLGLTPPVRLSGEIQDSPGLTLRGPKGEVHLTQGVIVARRHIHMPPDEAAARGLTDRQVVRLKMFTQRPLVFDDVVVRVDPHFTPRVHIDFDEANACAYRSGDFGMIIRG